MKSLILSLLSSILVSSIAHAAQVKDVTFAPRFSNGMCFFEETVKFASFPDVEVYSKTVSENTFRKTTHGVAISVEILAPDQYVLHLQPVPDAAPEASLCRTLKLKVLIR